MNWTNASIYHFLTFFPKLKLFHSVRITLMRLRIIILGMILCANHFIPPFSESQK